MTFATLRLAVTLARREMRSGLGGFRLFLACLALGVGAIAAILSFSLNSASSFFMSVRS